MNMATRRAVCWVVAAGFAVALGGSSAFAQAAKKPKKPAETPAAVEPAFTGFVPAMIEKVPADAMLVAAWGGYDGNAGYKSSKLAKLVDTLGLGKVWAEQAAAANKAAGGNAVAVGSSLFARPAIAWVRVAGTKVETVLMVDAGAEADGIATAVNNAMAKMEAAAPAAAKSPGKGKKKAESDNAEGGDAEKAPPPVRSSTRFQKEGQLLVLRQEWENAFPEATEEKKEGGENSEEKEAKPAKKRSPGRSGLLADDDFADAMTTIKGKPLAMVWLKPGLAYLPMIAHTAIIQNLQDSGLPGARFAVATGDFGKSGEWEADLFIAAKDRKGLAKSLLSERKVSPTLLARIPGDATYFEAFRLDTRELLEGFAAAFGDDPIGKLEEAKATESHHFNTPNAVEARINHWSLWIDQDLRGAVRALGPDFIATTVKSATVPGGEATVVLNRLRDGEKFRFVTDGAAIWLDRSSVDDKEGHWKFSTDERKGLTIHTLELEFPPPAVKPAGQADIKVCWGARDNLLAFSTDVDAVAAAFTTPPAGKSVVDSGRVKAILSDLGAPENAAVSALDLPAVWPAWHAHITAMATAIDMAKAVPGMKVAALVPDKDKVGAMLTPATSAGWTDAEGYHFKSRSPVPALDLFGPQPGLFQWISGLVKRASAEDPGEKAKP